MFRRQNHCNRPDQRRNHGHCGNVGIRPEVAAAHLNQFRPEKPDRVTRRRRQKEDNTHQPDSRIGKRDFRGNMLDPPGVLRVFRQLIFKPAFFVRQQPVRLRRAIRQKFQNDEPEQNGRNAFHNKQPLPARQPSHVLEGMQNHAANRSARQSQHGTQGQKPGHDPRPHSRRKPVGQVQNNAGKKARLRHAQQKAQGVETPRGLNKHHAG